jgi:hypothetical protein
MAGQKFLTSLGGQHGSKQAGKQANARACEARALGGERAPRPMVFSLLSIISQGCVEYGIRFS